MSDDNNISAGATLDIYANVEKTLDKLRETIVNDRSKTHGNAMAFAQVFTSMLNTFLQARQQAGQPFFVAADAFTILSMMKHARTAVAPLNVWGTYEHALDAAGYDVLRAAWLLPPEPVEQPVPTPPEPTIDELREQAAVILGKVRALGGDAAVYGSAPVLNQDDLAANQSMSLSAAEAPKDPEPQPDTAGTAGAAGDPMQPWGWHTDELEAGPEAPAKVG